MLLFEKKNDCNFEFQSQEMLIIFLKQADHIGLEPGWPSWQLNTLTIMLPPCPLDQVEKMI